jgi:PhnB protein
LQPFFANERSDARPDARARIEIEPEDTMTLNPHLSFNGQCEAAFKLYEQCLGGKITFMLTYANSPMKDQVPQEWQDKIAHGTWTIENNSVAGSDPPPGQYEQAKGFALLLNLNNPDEAERIFRTLSENGTVGMPMQQTFWALRFGSLVDQFGIPWAINCEQDAVNP